MNASMYTHQAAVSEEASQVESYESVATELTALDPALVQTINIDVPTAVATALGALPLIQQHRPALAKLDGFNIVRFDKLETYAKALTHANSLYLVATQPSDELRALQDEATKHREWLYKDVSVAVSRGIIPSDAIDDLRGANGYKNTATDLQILVSALQANWGAMKGRCGTTEAELEYAQKLAFHLLRTVGERGNGQLSVSEVGDKRARAFTLFFNAYNDARQAIAFVRREHGDVDRIAPTLFSGRTISKKKEATEATPNLPGVSPIPNPATTDLISPPNTAAAQGAQVPDPYGP